MKHGKIVLMLSVLEILSILASSSRAFAISEVAVENPESQLIVQVLAAQGSIRDSKALDSELVQVGTSYAQATKSESEEERAANFSNALIGMGISTPDQADKLLKQVQGSSSDAEIINVLKSLNGAQFSECTTSAVMTEYVGIAAGITAVSYGLGYKIGNAQYGIAIPASMMPILEAGSGVVVLGTVLILFHKHDCA
jgi:hypothetical protein